MSSSSFKLLVVDDNPEHREMWSRLLGGEGYRVETAVDGSEALRLVADEPFDLVLLDVSMPDMDGFDVLARLRESVSAEELPVIMATANGKSADIVHSFDLGANDYVVKPLNPAVLSARIQNQLRKRLPNPDQVVKVETELALAVTPGTVVAGRYRVDRLIGHGGAGAIYSGTHLVHGGSVALKMLRTSGGDAVQRLRREGISACRLEHPNAVEVLDLCLAEPGAPCLVMELLNGYGLDRELDRDGSLTPARCAEILVPVCDVLTTAHRRGIIHRDVKPQNIFLHQSHDGEVVKVLDFGIAKLLDDPGGALTLEGSLIGTPAYLAPERFCDTSRIDGRADVYSLGVMLYELLSGQRPFNSRRLPALIRMHLMNEPVPLTLLRPELPARIEAVVLSALAKDMDERPSAEGLARDFTAACKPRLELSG